MDKVALANSNFYQILSPLSDILIVVKKLKELLAVQQVYNDIKGDGTMALFRFKKMTCNLYLTS